jgi:hypothetical protein
MNRNRRVDRRPPRDLAEDRLQHLQRVRGKLGVHTRAQAYRIGLVKGDFEAHGLEREDVRRLAPPPVAAS